MTPNPECTGVQSLLPEYAAGALDARDRAMVDAHLETCVACRTEADSYVDVADELLLLAPSVEPPVGFETAVMTRIGQALPPRAQSRQRSVSLLAAAAAILLALGVGVGRSSAPSPQLAERAVALTTRHGYKVGNAVVHHGNPGWIFLTMNYPEDWSVKVEMVSLDGTVTPVGSLAVHDGRGSFGATSPVPIDQVRVIRMVGDDGRVLCQAVVQT